MILVILPSRNEIANIAFITRVVDEGLTTFFPGKNALILNVDSASADGTATEFLVQQVQTLKHCIILDSQFVGKGYNIRAGIEYGLANGFGHFVMLDTDLRSIRPDWIKSFLDPMIAGNAEYVMPLYRRNRYEGNTTNHFSSPLATVCWGQDIKQPIAGDFAFSRRLAERFLDQFAINSDYQYGIDTLLTWTALASRARVVQVDLGRKIHNPSFSKIMQMFPQVCASTLWQIRRYRALIAENIRQSDIPAIKECIPEPDFVYPPTPQALEDLRRSSESLLKQAGYSYTSQEVDAGVWADELSKCVSILVNDEIVDSATTNRMVESLSALYFAIVVNYIVEIQNLTPSEIGYILKQRSTLLCSTIKRNLGEEDYA